MLKVCFRFSTTPFLNPEKVSAGRLCSCSLQNSRQNTSNCLAANGHEPTGIYETLHISRDTTYSTLSTATGVKRHQQYLHLNDRHLNLLHFSWKKRLQNPSAWNSSEVSSHSLQETGSAFLKILQRRWHATKGTLGLSNLTLPFSSVAWMDFSNVIASNKWCKMKSSKPVGEQQPIRPSSYEIHQDLRERRRHQYCNPHLNERKDQMNLIWKKSLLEAFFTASVAADQKWIPTEHQCEQLANPLFKQQTAQHLGLRFAQLLQLWGFFSHMTRLLSQRLFQNSHTGSLPQNSKNGEWKVWNQATVHSVHPTNLWSDRCACVPSNIDNT